MPGTRSHHAALLRSHPGFPLLAAGDCTGVEALMQELGWIEPGERIIECERAGEGNMNLTLRVRSHRRSRILKQSRPWVEKYDQIAAPFDRALVEARFYRTVSATPQVAAAMPELLGADDASRTLLLEDLGTASDLSSLYLGSAQDNGRPLTDTEAQFLGSYLRDLHRATRGGDPSGLRNREMRRLNHEHIYVVPFVADNGVDLEALEPGLGAAAAELRADRALRARAAQLGERYLSDGPCLVHGDFFPGSWLRVADGRRGSAVEATSLKVIDPEFCFFGDPELDLGVAIAHLVLASQAPDRSRRLVEQAVDPAAERGLDVQLMAGFAGIEVIRRLLGVAQLPLAPSAGLRAAMLQRARKAMLDEGLEALWQ